jgi:xyloglucan-specific endo-beta-1,4-glucanase
MSDFDFDLTTLLQALWKNNLVPSNASLGLIEFGSEAFHSDQNVTFAVSEFGMDLAPGPSPELNITVASGRCHSIAPLSRPFRAGSFHVLCVAFVLSLVLLS